MATRNQGQGQTIAVRVVKLGETGGNKSRALPKGSTVADALRAAGHATQGFDVRVGTPNGTRKAALDSVLKDGQIVTLTPVQIVNGRS